MAWRSRPTANGWPRPRRTRRCACGTPLLQQDAGRFGRERRGAGLLSNPERARFGLAVRSATSCLSRLFSSSSCLRRRISGTPMPEPERRLADPELAQEVQRGADRLCLAAGRGGELGGRSLPPRLRSRSAKSDYEDACQLITHLAGQERRHRLCRGLGGGTVHSVPARQIFPRDPVSHLRANLHHIAYSKILVIFRCGNRSGMGACQACRRCPKLRHTLIWV